MMRRILQGAGSVAIAACYPTTTRPAFAPLPAAPQVEVQLSVADATRNTALVLNSDSIYVRRTEPKDGWLESEWLDAATLRPTSARRLGDGIVKVRMWADPSRPNYSMVTIETVYVPLADPSRDERSLEREAPDSNRIAKRVAAVIAILRKAYGDPIPAAPASAPAAGKPPGTGGG